MSLLASLILIILQEFFLSCLFSPALSLFFCYVLLQVIIPYHTEIAEMNENKLLEVFPLTKQRCQDADAANQHKP